MNNNLTELVYILDRSGSMAGLESDTIGGFNGMLEKQRSAPGYAVVTTVLFDNRIELLHDRIPLAGIASLTERDYFVRGSTALLDAIGFAIRKISQVHRHTAEAMRPGKTVFVIITDGMENSSREYTAGAVKALIEQQKQHGWEFLFLGANIDAIDVAVKIGIHSDRAVNYHADAQGTRLNYDVVGDAICHVRANCPMPADWKQRIDEDFQTRNH